MEVEELNEILRLQRPRVGKLPPLEAQHMQEQEEHFQEQYQEQEMSGMKGEDGRTFDQDEELEKDSPLKAHHQQRDEEEQRQELILESENLP